ncbi:MAG: glucose 1-dehydrogenase [Propionibacteriaceae bacterium]
MGTGALEGKTVIVTGGDTGIGAAIATSAARAGAHVIVDYVGSRDVADAFVKSLEGPGATGTVQAFEADVSKVDQVQDLVAEAVRRYGRLDVLVNNAGIETRQSLLETTEAAYDRVLGVDLKGAFFAAQAAARQFVAQGGGGVIVNISSVHEDWPMPGNAAYCVAKGGMRMLTRNSAVELGPYGIRVVGVAPGAVNTPINAETVADPAAMKRLDAAIPLGKMAEPAQIGDVVAFLASDAASYVTGTTVVVDGGLMQSSPGL